jgi:hypothetical protein
MSFRDCCAKKPRTITRLDDMGATPCFPTTNLELDEYQTPCFMIPADPVDDDVGWSWLMSGLIEDMFPDVIDDLIGQSVNRHQIVFDRVSQLSAT